MSADPFREGLARGWKAIDAAALAKDLAIEADVVVIGSGAGGGVTAETLAVAGLNVVLVEEGPLVTSGEFRMRERDAYPRLYQDCAGRQTLDRAITLLQGRCVGGSTTVNWTSSFRTPGRTLEYWRGRLGLASMDEASMAPWFARMEERLAIAPWGVPPNANNDALRRGCEKLGLRWGVIARNVRGCADLGYCGMGCPINAKQSMLVTTIPGALSRGATLVYRARVERLAWRGCRVVAAEARGVATGEAASGAARVRLVARHYVLAAGGIASPAILLRSRAPDPHLVAGKGTFLHPTVVSGALMPERIDGYHGAPQSIYSDHFLDQLPLDGPMGFKLEAPPVHPIIAGITLPGFGEAHSRWMRELPNMQVTIALLRDGFHPQSRGGRVVTRPDGTALLDYPIGDYLGDGIRRAYLALAEIQFAAGASQVMPMHDDAAPARSFREARALIGRLGMGPLGPRIASAHVMGGCAMGVDPRASVVRPDGVHHQLENLSVHDASVFPTSLATNPQLSIYAIAARFSAALAERLDRPAVQSAGITGSRKDAR